MIIGRFVHVSLHSLVRLAVPYSHPSGEIPARRDLNPTKETELSALNDKRPHPTADSGWKPNQMNAINQPWTWSTTQGDGHPALADFLAQDPDHETYVFRKFKKLAVRNVLYLQGELTALEEEVETLEREAAKSDDPEVHLSMRSWKSLDENARRAGREKSLEYRLRQRMGGLDEKLKTYC